MILTRDFEIQTIDSGRCSDINTVTELIKMIRSNVRGTLFVIKRKYISFCLNTILKT